MSKIRVFLGVPTFTGLLTSRAAQTIYTASTVNEKMELVNSSSLLCYGFNSLWCTALNMRNAGITHFAMLHADIQPEDGWIDTILDQMEMRQADICSAVVPMKGPQGLTSTAIDTNPWAPRRLTIKETDRLPVTFDAEDVPWSDGRKILVNSGCWVCDFTKPWVEQVWFEIRDRIACVNGEVDPVR